MNINRFILRKTSACIKISASHGVKKPNGNENRATFRTRFVFNSVCSLRDANYKLQIVTSKSGSPVLTNHLIRSLLHARDSLSNTLPCILRIQSNTVSLGITVHLKTFPICWPILSQCCCYTACGISRGETALDATI